MLKKSAFPLSVSLLVSLLHVGCCLFPLITLALGSVSIFGFLARYKPIISGVQILLLVYLGVLITMFYLGKHRFHSIFEKWSYHIAFVIALAGLLIGILEPFQSEQQKIAQKQFQLFQTHRQIALNVSGNYDRNTFKEDIKAIEGIKASSVKVNGAMASATFKSDQVSPTQIVNALRGQGYEVAIME